MITIETEIRDPNAILVFKKLNAFLSEIERHYFHDRHILGKDLSKLKSDYLVAVAKYKIPLFKGF